MHATPGTRLSTGATRRKRERLLLENGPFCCLCGGLILRGQVTLDHRQSVQHGGGNGLDNLGLAHAGCNQAKGGAQRRPLEQIGPCGWCANQMRSLRRRGKG